LTYTHQEDDLVCLRMLTYYYFGSGDNLMGRLMIGVQRMSD